MFNKKLMQFLYGQLLVIRIFYLMQTIRFIQMYIDAMKAPLNNIEQSNYWYEKDICMTL